MTERVTLTITTWEFEVQPRRIQLELVARRLLELSSHPDKCSRIKQIIRQCPQFDLSCRVPQVAKISESEQVGDRFKSQGRFDLTTPVLFFLPTLLLQRRNLSAEFVILNGELGTGNIPVDANICSRFCRSLKPLLDAARERVRSGPPTGS